MKHSRLWSISVALSTLLINMWINMSRVDLQPTQLVNEQDVDDYLYQHWKDNPESPTIKIKTGIFMPSLNFFNSYEVNISAYIWQRYTDGIHDAIKPKPS
jgi:hypothetical protein